MEKFKADYLKGVRFSKTGYMTINLSSPWDLCCGEDLRMDHLLLELKRPAQSGLSLLNSLASVTAEPNTKGMGILYEKFPRTPSSPSNANQKGNSLGVN
tara:strand:- start:11050 stop:11346 length:297 start_codon:yes stop_codon:yes gene_type:complete